MAVFNRAAEFPGQGRNLLIQRPHIFQTAVHVGVLGPRIDAGHLGTADKGDGGVLPHRRIAKPQIGVDVRERPAQGNSVIGMVDFLGENRDVPDVQTAGVHGLNKAVGGGPATNHHHLAAARSGGLRRNFVRV